jgi:hypothetical protein
LNKACSRHLSDLIQKVLEISKYKKIFKESPEEFFTSRKLFVTFKSSTDAWSFKTLYNNGYIFKWSNLFRSMPVDLRRIKLDIDNKKQDQKELLKDFSTLVPLEERDDIESSKEPIPLAKSISISNI